MPQGEQIGHHGTHTQLLVPELEDGDPLVRIDAIVVPTVRAPASLDSAIALGRTLRCRVLALCSNATGAYNAAFRARDSPEFTALDVSNPALPAFETSALLAGTKFQRHTDTSLKRNVGLAIAAMAGWQRVVFLDDDMVVRRPENVLIAASRLKKFDAVGLQNDGFPDNSVVCHALRAVGGTQDTFIGAGALAVRAGREASFFPAVYNEDWFFLLGSDQINPVSIAGTVTQAPFDPYEDPERAGSEEFGDCLGEGVFALLDDGGHIHDADALYWKDFLADRRAMITEIRTRIPGLRWPLPEKLSMDRALRTALDRLRSISPELCVEYLELWHRDRLRWTKFLSDLPSASASDAIRFLRVAPANWQRARSVALPDRRRVVLHRIARTPDDDKSPTIGQEAEVPATDDGLKPPTVS